MIFTDWKIETEGPLNDVVRWATKLSFPRPDEVLKKDHPPITESLLVLAVLYDLVKSNGRTVGEFLDDFGQGPYVITVKALEQLEEIGAIAVIPGKIVVPKAPISPLERLALIDLEES